MVRRGCPIHYSVKAARYFGSPEHLTFLRYEVLSPLRWYTKIMYTRMINWKKYHDVSHSALSLLSLNQKLQGLSARSPSWSLLASFQGKLLNQKPPQLPGYLTACDRDSDLLVGVRCCWSSTASDYHLKYIPCVQIGSRLPGEVPLSGTFPGNPIVWTLAGTSPGGPTKHVGSGEERERPWARNWYRTAVFIKCAHAPNVVAQWSNTQPKPLNRDCPRKVGAFEKTVWTVGRKKDMTSPNCPR